MLLRGKVRKKLRGKGGMRGLEGLSIQRRVGEQMGKVRMGEMESVVIECMTRVRNTVVARMYINPVVLLLAVLGRRESKRCGR